MLKLVIFKICFAIFPILVPPCEYKMLFFSAAGQEHENMKHHNLNVCNLTLKSFLVKKMVGDFGSFLMKNTEPRIFKDITSGACYKLHPVFKITTISDHNKSHKMVQNT